MSVQVTYKVDGKLQPPEVMTSVVLPGTEWVVGCNQPGPSSQTFEHAVVGAVVKEPRH